MMKVIMIALLALGLTNCSQSNYKVNKEVNKEGRVLDKVPQWYVDATINEGIILNRDANTFIYSVGQGTSPDLQLALEKAMMIAKAELADKLQGQMNKRTDLYITEVGQDNSKQVVSKIEETVVKVLNYLRSIMSMKNKLLVLQKLFIILLKKFGLFLLHL